ncbi:hypothetical protein KR009_003151 [Drosophila setifemur]|nr:hypothetical protein KR009_003151 [Drosophila setifemur]
MLRQIQMRASLQLQLLKRSTGLHSHRLKSQLPVPIPEVDAIQDIPDSERSPFRMSGSRAQISDSFAPPEDMESQFEEQGSKQMEHPTEPRPRAPLYNPLRRRHSVNRSRLQYINDKYKELANEVETRKPKTKQFVTRHSLHSGRNDKID